MNKIVKWFVVFYEDFPRQNRLNIFSLHVKMTTGNQFRYKNQEKWELFFAMNEKKIVE